MFKALKQVVTAVLNPFGVVEIGYWVFPCAYVLPLVIAVVGIINLFNTNMPLTERLAILAGAWYLNYGLARMGKSIAQELGMKP